MACPGRARRALGIGVDHLDAHLGGVELKPEFFDVYLDLAEEYHLPVRLPGPDAERRLGFPFRDLAAERGVLSPDRAVALGTLGNNVTEVRSALLELPEGVSEIYLRPADDSPELRVAAPDAEERVREAGLLAGAPRAPGRAVRAHRLSRPCAADARLTAAPDRARGRGGHSPPRCIHGPLIKPHR